MSDYLTRVFGSKVKVAAQVADPGALDLSKISAADFLQGLQDGTIVPPEEPEKVAGQDDITTIPTEQLVALARELEKTAAPSPGVSTAMDLNTLSPNEIRELASLVIEEIEAEHGEVDVEKVAAALQFTDATPYGIDLNDLSVEDFLEFASGLEGDEVDVEKTAGVAGFFKRMGGEIADAAKGGGIRRGLAKLREGKALAGKTETLKSFAANAGKRMEGKRGPAFGAMMAKKISTADTAATEATKAGRKQTAIGAAKTGALYGTPLAAAGAIAASRRRK